MNGRYRYPSDLELNDDLYLVDTCVWIDIANQLSNLEIPFRRRQSGILNPSVEVILSRIFSNRGHYKLYVSKEIKKEYLDVFSRGKENLRNVSPEIQKLVFDYMLSLNEDDTYFISSNGQLLTRDLKDKQDKYRGDRKIFVSGRSRYIGNIVTQDWDDYKEIRKDLLDKYNPTIYKCTSDKEGFFNGLELKGGKLTQPRKIKESLAGKLLRYLHRLLENYI